MSIINFLVIAIISVLASIVYEFTVISRFIAEQNLNYRTNVPADIEHRECLTGPWFNDLAALAQPEDVCMLDDEFECPNCQAL
jgi:hypothetical protein